MKPAAFEFVRARTLSEATTILLESEGAARVVAGAQSLGPMLNLRLVQPRILVDVTGIAELTEIDDRADAVTLGACITTANIEDGRLPGRGLQPLSVVAGRIAYRAVRNRGTIGGSVCHADPAADWISALCALGAQCVIAGPGGPRRLAVEDFVTGAGLSPDGRTVAIRTYSTIYFFFTSRDGHLETPSEPLGCNVRRLGPQGEGVGWLDGRRVVLTSERNLLRAGTIAVAECPLPVPVAQR